MQRENSLSPASKPTRKRIMPGFGLSMGVTITYLSLIVLIPLAGLFWKTTSLGWLEFWRRATDERTLDALRLSFGTALIAALLNVFFGLLVAWVFTRYRFPGRRLLDAMIDLPFALPTAVAGIALATIYAPNGSLGHLLTTLGIKVAFAPLGIIVALTFIGLPFMVRTVQPVLAELDRELEEAAATLGASRRQTITRIILPALIPAILAGFAMALARGVGEYGSVIFIAGNIPFISEIAPLLIVIKLEEFDYAGATALASMMLVLSFSLLFALNLLEARFRRKYHHA